MLNFGPHILTLGKLLGRATSRQNFLDQSLKTKKLVQIYN